MYADNPRIRFDYDILETLIAGMVLDGREVKAVRSGRCSIKGSYVKILGGEAYLIGASIAPYQTGNTPLSYDPQSTRKLLVKKSELRHFHETTQERGLTLVPLKVFDQHGLIKLELGIARGKKKYDKRMVIAKRDTQRTIQRSLHSR